MRFSNGRYDEKVGDGLNGASHWTVIFDNQEDKAEHLYDLVCCSSKYDALLNNIYDRVKSSTRINSEKIINKMVDYLQEKAIIDTLIQCTVKPHLFEFDYVFITQRDQGCRPSHNCPPSYPYNLSLPMPAIRVEND